MTGTKMQCVCVCDIIPDLSECSVVTLFRTCSTSLVVIVDI